MACAEGADEWCGEVGGGWLHLPLNSLRMQELTEIYVVCNGKIKSALGVERMPVGAREGLLETLRVFAGERKR